MSNTLYPGCSLQRSARPYLDLAGGDQDDLDIELLEIDDWNCWRDRVHFCGAATRLMRSTGAIWRWRLISRTARVRLLHRAARATSISPKPTAICASILT